MNLGKYMLGIWGQKFGAGIGSQRVNFTISANFSVLRDGFLPMNFADFD